MSEKIALTVDLGGTNLRVAAVSEDGKILAREDEFTSNDGDSGEVVTNQIIRQLLKVKSNFSDESILGIGIGVPGALDKKRGIILKSNVSKFPVSIFEPLKGALSLPVCLLNDASVAAMGELRYGAARGLKNFAYITISTGIGSGMVIDGHLIDGESSNAGEVGHFVFENKYNIPCRENLRYGTWDGYASGKHIPRFFAAWGEKQGLEKEAVVVTSTPELFERVKSNDPIALDFMEELGRVNGMGVTNVIMAYNPERIVLGGSVSIYHGEVLVKYFMPYVDDFLKIPEIVITSLGNDNALLGAAALVFEKED